MLHAQVKNNTIISLISSPSVEIEPDVSNIKARLIEGAYWVKVPDGTRVGAKWDGLKFTNKKSATIVPALEFWERFTRQERIILRNAAKNDPVIEDFIETMKLYMILNRSISVAAQDTMDGINYLVAQGLMDQARADQFFAPAQTDDPSI